MGVVHDPVFPRLMCTCCLHSWRRQSKQRQLGLIGLRIDSLVDLPNTARYLRQRGGDLFFGCWRRETWHWTRRHWFWSRGNCWVWSRGIYSRWDRVNCSVQSSAYCSVSMRGSCSGSRSGCCSVSRRCRLAALTLFLVLRALAL